MKILKNMTKKKILILSSAAFLALATIVFLCSLRTQKIDLCEKIDSATFNKIIVNADCDVEFRSEDADFTTLSLTGTSKQLFKKPLYKSNIRIEDGNLIVDVKNDSAYFFKDIRYDIKLLVVFPPDVSSAYDVILNSKQGIFTINNAEIASFSATDINGKFYIHDSTLDSFKLDGYSGYMHVQNSFINNFDVKRMRTGQIGLFSLESSAIKIGLLDGLIHIDNLSGHQDRLDVDISFRKGSCIVIMETLSFLKMFINTDEAHTSVSLKDVDKVSCDLSTKKGKIQNSLDKSETDDIFVKINSEKGNIVLKNH